MARVKYKALYLREQAERQAIQRRLDALRRCVAGLEHEGRNVLHRISQGPSLPVLWGPSLPVRLPYHEWLALAAYLETFTFLEMNNPGILWVMDQPVTVEEPA